MRRDRFRIFVYLIVLIMISGLTEVWADDSIFQEKNNTSENITSLSENNLLSDFIVSEDPVSIFEIKIVSPEFLKTMQNNADDNDQILKIGPGMTIGVSTPQALYIRGDLQSDDYLLQNRNKTDIKDTIVEHLVKIVYGRDNANTSLLNSDLDYKIWFDEEYTTDDINTSLDFVRTFNNLSTATHFEDDSVLKGDMKDNYEEIPYHYYQIKISSREFIDDYKDDKYKSSSEELFKDKNGKLVGIIAPGYVYLWNGLEDNERSYYITKALLWNLGLHGETSTEPDSFFYTKANTSATLSELDKQAIELLYGGRLNTGMNADAVRKALNINL
jgi:hypothetical protein